MNLFYFRYEPDTNQIPSTRYNQQFQQQQQQRIPTFKRPERAQSSLNVAYFDQPSQLSGGGYEESPRYDDRRYSGEFSNRRQLSNDDGYGQQPQQRRDLGRAFGSQMRLAPPAPPPKPPPRPPRSSSVNTTTRYAPMAPIASVNPNVSDKYLSLAQFKPVCLTCMKF